MYNAEMVSMKVDINSDLVFLILILFLIPCIRKAGINESDMVLINWGEEKFIYWCVR